jgi:hypothetical protein
LEELDPTRNGELADDSTVTGTGWADLVNIGVVEKDPTRSGEDSDSTLIGFDIELEDFTFAGGFESSSEKEDDEGAPSGVFVFFFISVKVRPVGFRRASSSSSTSSSSSLESSSTNVRFFSPDWANRFDEKLIVAFLCFDAVKPDALPV